MTNLSSIDLAALVERDGVTLLGQSERYGACPKCGGKDRFHVRWWQDRDYFFCRQCHERRGDAIEYLRWQHGMSFVEAVKALGLNDDQLQAFERAQAAHAAHATYARQPRPTTPRGVAIPNALDEAPAAAWQTRMMAFVHTCSERLWRPQGAKALAYLRETRGLSDETIGAFHLGFCALDDRKHGIWRGITIPAFYAGELWGVNTRRATGEPKYLKVTGSRAQLFNADALASGARGALVCGGEFDTMLAQQHAPAGVACITFGSETKRPTWEADYLLRGVRVLIALDNDAAGDAGAKQWAAFGERIHVPRGKDITEFWQQGGDVGDWIRAHFGVIDADGTNADGTNADGTNADGANASAHTRISAEDDHELEQQALEALAHQGYECSYSADGRIIARRATSASGASAMSAVGAVGAVGVTPKQPDTSSPEHIITTYLRGREPLKVSAVMGAVFTEQGNARPTQADADQLAGVIGSMVKAKALQQLPDKRLTVTPV